MGPAPLDDLFPGPGSLVRLASYSRRTGEYDVGHPAKCDQQAAVRCTGQTTGAAVGVGCCAIHGGDHVRPDPSAAEWHLRVRVGGHEIDVLVVARIKAAHGDQ